MANKSSKQSWPYIRKRVYPNGSVGWTVDARTKNGGVRKTYETKAEAETFAEQQRSLRTNEGTSRIEFPDRLRMDALDCANLLKPFGVSLRHAVDYFIKHARPAGGVKALSDIRTEFLQTKSDANRRAAYLRVQRYILGKFCEAFGERHASEVHPDEISAWIQSHEWAQRTRLNYHNDLSNFFGFAIRKGYCAENPLGRLDKPSVDESLAPEFFTPAEAAELLNAAERLQGKMTAFFAIGMFAGLRTTELLKLDWRNVDLQSKTIEVTAGVSKTREHRYVTISANLAAWLRPYCRVNGAVRPAAWRWHRDAARREAKLEKWPDNGMRHSFGSYHFARHNNAPLTAAEMGHRGNTQTLFAHYRALVTPKDATRYWEIKPISNSKKVVAFKQVAA